MIDGLTRTEDDLIKLLTTQVGAHRANNERLAAYYDGTHRVRRIGVAVPRTLGDIGVVSGWPATIVDTYGDLLRMDGFISPDYPDQMRTITRRFHVPLRVSEAILDMLIFGLGLLAVEPDIILADEPTTLLDLRNREMLRIAFERLEQQILCCTHDL